MRKARSLTQSEIKKVLKRCLLMQEPELKRAALVLSLSTLRVSELAQITISDLLLPTGEIKTELHLRAALCKRRRPLFLVIAVVITTLILQKAFDLWMRAKENEAKANALKLLKAHGYEPKLYLATIGIEDAELRHALDQFSFTGHVIENRNGHIIGGLVPKVESSETKPKLKLIVSND